MSKTTITTIADYIEANLPETDPAFDFFCELAGKELRVCDPERVVVHCENAIKAYKSIERLSANEYIGEGFYYERVLIKPTHFMYELHAQNGGVYIQRMNIPHTDAAHKATMAWAYSSDL